MKDFAPSVNKQVHTCISLNNLIGPGKSFLSAMYKLYGSDENCKLKMLGETSTRFFS